MCIILVRTAEAETTSKRRSPPLKMHERSSLELPIQSQVQSFYKRPNQRKAAALAKQAVKTEGTQAHKK